MTKRVTVVGLAIVLTLPVTAQAAEFASMDVNGDGYITMSEFQAAMPETPGDAFMAADTNADGALTAEELASAQEAGTLPSSDG
ncbi:MAG: calcium-binding protein [Rhodobacteraceae bacterium CG17_big_fil_post_rev_8_21_14_2_50_63_15]|nr:EF-hand domain-containing protein [Roseovarius sp.]PIV77467.1 MAG: calcium-binding protein [Rhodobacteraceae bacterium CG17_big_fil_post_rev_8_21_14_2_50_63_15]